IRLHKKFPRLATPWSPRTQIALMPECRWRITVATARRLVWRRWDTRTDSTTHFSASPVRGDDELRGPSPGLQAMRRTRAVRQTDGAEGCAPIPLTDVGDGDAALI